MRTPPPSVALGRRACKSTSAKQLGATISGETNLFGGRVRFISLSTIEEERGRLVVFDYASLPFMPRRSFFVDGVPAGTFRGGHAHVKADQVLVCLRGRLSVELMAGQTSLTVALGPADRALFIGAGIWSRQFHEEPGTQMLAFSSTPFDPDGYVENPP